MKISVVTTIFHSTDFINEFYNKMSNIAKNVSNDDYELIFVNDGSIEKDLEIISNLSNSDKNLTIIDLSRNFGHYQALMTGLKESTGDYIFFIDSDLEEDPEWLKLFFNEINNHNNIDIVIGQQSRRKGSFLERITGYIYYFFIVKFIEKSIIQNHTTACLMTRRYANSLLEFKENDLTLTVLFFLNGFKQKILQVTKKTHSPTTYSFYKKMGVLLKNITSLSGKPLVFIFVTGLTISAISFFIFTYIIFQKIYFGVAISGWASLLASIWLLGGIIILFLGIIGIYIHRVFIETKKRPNAIIRNVIKK